MPTAKNTPVIDTDSTSSSTSCHTACLSDAGPDEVDVGGQAGDDGVADHAGQRGDRRDALHQAHGVDERSRLESDVNALAAPRPSSARPITKYV